MLKKYRILLFDADDTLLDFKASQNAALTKLFLNHGFQMTKEIRAQYELLNAKLWGAFEKGEIKQEEILNTRFGILFHNLGYDVDGILLEREYQQVLSENHQVIAGAFDLLEQLKNLYDLYIVSNGVAYTQHRRLTESGLAPYFKKIFVSEETGYQKPKIEFFEFVFERIPTFNKAETLIIGDSLSSDMQGGINAGLDTCWYNKNQTENKKKLPITYEIHNLESLLPILEK